MIAKDKIQHFILGFIISFSLGLINPWLGGGAAFIVGWGKEQFDKRDPEHHTYDVKDMYATWIGGIAGILILWLKYQ